MIMSVTLKEHTPLNAGATSGRYERPLSRAGESLKLLAFMICIHVMVAWPRASLADDLNPVTIKQAPKMAPIVLVANGKPIASICVMGVPASKTFACALQELQECLEEATGAKVPVVKGKIVDGPALVIGSCPEAVSIGLNVKDMPVEGFVIKTVKDKVYVLGNDAPISGTNRVVQGGSFGTAWGVYEFLERVVGVRWYWPTNEGGRSVPENQNLAVVPLWIEDAPVFRRRDIFPSMGRAPLIALHTALRAGNSWPNCVVPHAPHALRKITDYGITRPEIFQKRKDGSRDDLMLCYGNPRTLQTYIERLPGLFGKDPSLNRGDIGVIGNSISVSPWDADIACYCDDCRRLWGDKEAGYYGAASRVMGEFVVKLANEVRLRWPDKTIIFLPYMNYAFAPTGISFPDNVEVQLCGMPGLAMYKEPAVYKRFQDNIDEWKRLTRRKVQTWDYSCWPEDKIKVPFQYPHVLKMYYQGNRDNIVGSMINGVKDHWPRQNVSLYCWLKLLWNPDFDVDAAMDVFCRRMFGPAAGSMRELLRMQCDGWEKSRWPDGVLSAKAVYGVSFPRATLERVKQLLETAHKEAGEDPVLQKRITYYEAPFAESLSEYEFIIEGKGIKSLAVKKVAENPVIDGKLDDPAWQFAESVELSKYDTVTKKEVKAVFPTSVKAVWTREGVTFAFVMSEPNPGALKKDCGDSYDDGSLWKQDCAEIYLDPSGDGNGASYQLLITAGGGVVDAKGADLSWKCEGLKQHAYICKDFWSLEVFIPISAFPEAKAPNTGVIWNSQFTRHRMSDCLWPDGQKGGVETQKLNARNGGWNSNTGDFAPLRFIE